MRIYYMSVEKGEEIMGILRVERKKERGKLI